MSSKLFYRFRSINRLLNDKELENSEIYFAAHENLNDPMEGFYDFTFNGDEIIWKNFFKHYLMCLERVNNLYLIVGELQEHTIAMDDIPIYNSFNDFPTPIYKELFEKIAKDFFDICGEFIKKIATRTTSIRKDELSTYFNSVHFIALQIIQKHYEKYNFIKRDKKLFTIDTKPLKQTIKLIDTIEKLIKEENEALEKLNLFIVMQREIHNELKLVSAINDKLYEKSPNRYFIVENFVDNYLKCIEKLTFPSSYIACFSAQEATNNSSVWGHYGNSHQGVCLIFDANENETLSFLNAKVGYGSKGAILGKRDLKFEEVIYTNNFVEIDFFKSLGSLTIPILEEWYSDDEGNFSKIKIDNDDVWRKKYWDTFEKNNLTKTKDWQYEHEFRLILHGSLDNEIDEKYRKLRYDFKNLKGIIFGIKTSVQEKEKIIKIIRQKCLMTSRNDFEFYQAYYCHQNKNIQYQKLSFIKFAGEKDAQ